MGSVNEIPEPILVVAAHPDDIEVHCGGTLVQLVALGKRVSCVLCTSGNRGTDNPKINMEDIGVIREKEQRAASKILGIKDIRFLRHDDGDLQFIQLQLREEIVRLIREIKPKAIITHDPYPGDGTHDSCSIYPDHITAGKVTFQSAYVIAPGPLFYPQHLEKGLQPFKPSVIYLIMSGNPNWFIDVTSTWSVKLAAIRKHRSQGRHKAENDREMEHIARQNGKRFGVDLAEPFRTLLPS